MITIVYCLRKKGDIIELNIIIVHTKYKNSTQKL